MKELEGKREEAGKTERACQDPVVRLQSEIAALLENLGEHREADLSLLDERVRQNKGLLAEAEKAHKQLANLGLLGQPALSPRSFVPWRRYRPLEGISLNVWQRAAVQSLAILSKYYKVGLYLTGTVEEGR